MTRGPQCDSCKQGGCYVFSNGEEICRGYYQAIETEVREKIAQRIEQEIDADHQAQAFMKAADIARGIEQAKPSATPNDFYNRSCKVSGHQWAAYQLHKRCIWCGDHLFIDEALLPKEGAK